MMASEVGIATSASTAHGLAVDARSLDALRQASGRAPQAALKEAARQFEALFMRELLKSMREATMKSGLLDNAETDLSTELLDEQLALKLTGLPGGLSEMIERQLRPHVAAGSASSAAAPSAAREAAPATGGPSQATPRQIAFIHQHRAAAQQVARETGIPAAFMIGQAALETGWGSSEIRFPDGRNSHNLFGIKAGPGWSGQVAEVTTTEYVNGQRRKLVQRFRAYDSYADAFRDYARLISQSPRYQAVMRNLHSVQAFAQQLQQAGYATDPQYATKLGRVINTTLALQRALA